MSKKQDQVDELFDLLSLSAKRRRFLLLLLGGPKTLEEIKNSLKVTSTGMLPQIRKMEKRNLVCQKDKKYTLTAIGEVIAGHFHPLVKTIEVIGRHVEFWETHEVEALPMHLLRRIRDLGSYKIVESGVEEIYLPHKEFLENLMKSLTVRGVTPIFHPLYPDFFLKLIEGGVDVSLILTGKVYDKLRKEYSDKLRKAMGFENARFFICNEDIRLAFVSTDRFFSLSLFFKDGAFDSQKDLISYDKSAIKWGEELFNYYKNRSTELKDV